MVAQLINKLLCRLRSGLPWRAPPTIFWLDRPYIEHRGSRLKVAISDPQGLIVRQRLPRGRKASPLLLGNYAHHLRVTVESRSTACMTPLFGGDTAAIENNRRASPRKLVPGGDQQTDTQSRKSPRMDNLHHRVWRAVVGKPGIPKGCDDADSLPIATIDRDPGPVPRTRSSCLVELMHRLDLKAVYL
ncbi:hypothetical protein IU485_21135 [Nocardia cyriacigeorgica]|uniref:hypothetical protein n=1 Tax=Nocardia cyriacigeorgica TaxID=135487 RepID=UPI001893083D|nr:hypothetical protein [Nocardia cyriacigeorgica]MBF6083877.1 hypothetical protein [Nocardia cyriacigeorgica]